MRRQSQDMKRIWNRQRIGTRWLAILAIALATAACTSDTVPVDSTNPPRETSVCEPLDLDLSTSEESAPLHLWVSNQSFDIDAVDIAVYIDDHQVVCDSFDVEDQHNWILFAVQLDPGTHDLRAVGLDGQVELIETIDVPAERWAVLDFWFYPQEKPEHFTFRVQDQPIGFD